MTFKVGDTVRVTNVNGDTYGYWIDKVGSIKEPVDDEDYEWNVHFPDAKQHCWFLESELELVTEAPTPISDGGPSAYYDWEPAWVTLNDFIEHKSLHQWKEHSFHWGNVVKALTRWGDKDGTTKTYDAKKVIYSGCRVLKAIIGVDNLRAYLQKLLDDPQFQSKGNN